MVKSHKGIELKENTKRILRLIQEQEPLNSRDLERLAGVSQSTISRCTTELSDLRYIYIKRRDGKAYYYYNNKQAALAALKKEFLPMPSPIFSVTENTLAVKIDPRFYRVYETDFLECFYNEDFEGKNEIFAITFSGDVMYIHLWKEPVENKTTYDEALVLKKNIELISDFFNHG